MIYLCLVENLHHTHGTFSEVTIERAGKMVGEVGMAIDKVFSQNIANTHIKDAYRKKEEYHDDIMDFVKEFKADRLFDIIPGRSYPSFPEFACQLKIANPELLKARLRKYTRNLDREKRD